MDLFIFIAISIISCAVFIGHGIAIHNKKATKQQIIDMATGGDPVSLYEIELSKPFSTRIIDPALKDVNKLLAMITPKEIEADARRRIRRSGIRISVSSFISIQVISAIALPVLFTLIGVIYTFTAMVSVLIVLFSIVIGYFIPALWLEAEASKRNNKIQRALPDALDILTVSVEAGLGFDMALSKVVEKTSGPLTDEFSIVLHEIRMGRSRSDALSRLSERINVEDLIYFISALIQSDKLGVSIINLLRIQSDQMRIKRHQRAEQIAHKAPLKMSLVLILFVLPALLLILLGPSFISMMATFGGR